ncbi:hypothetical protein UFOVP257_297 [uncultured Caudovirales phage]|uniref:Uncharacterized protein n=1 Tax=uncultured Caudovirales phage TaxID=2100421 RepID=A0A6J5LHA9_9CAUD|nr:hypothetical protein UFOVP257_297 [uncultured Caudovirales phage]
MSKLIDKLREQATDDILGVPVLNNKKFAELVMRESIIDFYRRYLDTNSNEDITIQVERYIHDNFGA